MKFGKLIASLRPALHRTRDRYLSRHKHKGAEECQRVALGHYSLGKPEAALDELEVGLKRYPDAPTQYLFEHYVRISLRIGKIDRALQFVGSKDDAQTCETLLSMPFVDSEIAGNLIAYLFSRGFGTLAEQGLRSFIDRHDTAAALWGLGDTLSHRGRSNEAEIIYRKIVTRSLESPDDFYYVSLAYLRLQNVERCLEILEQGQRAYSKHDLLSDLYIYVCAAHSNVDHYCRFMRELGNLDVVAAKAEFFKSVSRHSEPDVFILVCKDIERQCSRSTFEMIKECFILSLEKRSVSARQAKSIVYLSKYMDVDAALTSRVFSILQCAELANGDMTKHALRLLGGLTVPMVPHYEVEPAIVLNNFIENCVSLSKESRELDEPIGDMGNYWTPWQQIFCLAAPEGYGKAMSAFEKAAFATWPKLNFTSPHISQRCDLSNESKRKIRIGFNVHDSMPMMSGLMSHLDANKFETVFLRPGKAGTSVAARDWVARAGETVEYSDVNTYSAIETIAAQRLDIIISGPCADYSFYPMMARLASLQMVLLEPNWTDGLTNSDYYISWQMAEPPNPANFYKSAVSFLQHPPYWIERPAVATSLSFSAEDRDETRQRLLGLGPESRIYLCANTPPKINPAMDAIFLDLLERDEAATLVLLRGDFIPARTLKTRLQEKLGKHFERVIFLPTLEKNDAHALLLSVDCCLDSYPLCGMSSSFDGMMLGVPIVTWPADIPFGRWTAAIYEYIGVTGLTAKDGHDYVEIAYKLACDKGWRREISLEIKEKSARYVESMSASNELQEFIIAAWERKISGLPPANWLFGRWQ